jgi:hypothetical protein
VVEAARRAASVRFRTTAAVAATRAAPTAIRLFCRAPGWVRPQIAACLAALAAGRRRPGLGGSGCRSVSLEGFLDAPGGRGADVLVDGECLLQVRGSLAGVTALQVASAKSFQGACFFRGRADVAGDGQRPGVLVVGLLCGRGPERELAEAVQRLGLAEQVAQVAEQPMPQ